LGGGGPDVETVLNTWRQVLEQARPDAWRPLLPGPLRRPAIAVLAGCAAITVVVGIWFAGQRTAGWPDRPVDAHIQSFLAGHYSLLSHIALIGNPIAVTGTAAVLCALCLVARRWRGAVLAVIGPAAAGAVTEYLLKPLFDRRLEGYLSMPSGHTAGAFSLAAVLAVLLAEPGRPHLPAAARIAVVAAAAAVASSVGFAMVGIGAHYFTDTIAGAAVGTGIVLGCALLLDLPGQPGRAARGRSDRGDAGQ
jgi:membrane-associated phospholipid phosphatase